MIMDNELNLPKYWGIVKRGRWYLIVPFVVISVVTVLVGLLLSDVYQSSTLILVEPQKVPEEYVKSTVTGSIEDRLSTIQQQILSRTLLQKIIDELGLYKKEARTKVSEEIIELMRNNITVKGENTRQMSVDAFSIKFKGEDPKTVWLVTAKLASLFIEENLKVREEQAVSTSEFMESEVASAKQVVEEQEQKIAAYKAEYMGELPEQLDTNLRTLDRMQVDLTATVEGLKVNEDRKSSLESLIMEARARGGPGGGPNDGKTADLGTMKMRLAALQGEYKENYPDIVILKRQIQEFETQEKARATATPLPDGKSDVPGVFSGDAFVRSLATQLIGVSTDIRTLKERQRVLIEQIRGYERHVENTPQREQEFMILVRDYQNFSRNYQVLLDKKINARISENLERRQKGEQFRILDPAYLPQKPIWPNRWLINLLGMAVGLGTGIALVVAREMGDDSLRDEREIESDLRLGVIASIPHFAVSGRVPVTRIPGGGARRFLPWRKGTP